jgi:uncharacterized membrane protein
MNIETFKTFFMWCTIIDASIIALWVSVYLLIPDVVYKTQSSFTKIPRETFNIVFYSFTGIAKLLFLLFNLVPYIALVIMSH